MLKNLVLLVTAFGEYSTPCSVLPPMLARQEPTVPYRVVTVVEEDVQRLCGLPPRPALACVIPAPKDGRTLIVMDERLSGLDYSCVLLYEKAHLPPNNWVDEEWEAYLMGGQD